MLNCRETKDAVDTASVRSGLVKGAEAHLNECSDCRQYANSTLMLMGMLSAQPRVEVPADFDFRLRARIARARDENRGWRWSLAQFWSRSFSWKEAAAAVAMLTAVASSTTFYLSRDRATPNQMAAFSTPMPVVTPGTTLPTKESGPAMVGNTHQNSTVGQTTMAQPFRRQINPTLVRAVAIGEGSLAGPRGSFELAGTQEILVYQPGRAGRPGASRSVVIPRRGQVAFGAQLASTQGALGSRPVPSQSAVETF